MREFSEQIPAQALGHRLRLAGVFSPQPCNTGQRVSNVMRGTQLLGAALLIAGSSIAAPAMAASFPTTSPSVAIREADPLPSFDEKLLRQMPPALIANGLLASAAVSVGQASWYGPGFYGNRTANGEVFRRGTLTAAHRNLPFGTMVRVTNLYNGRSAVVRINDRGPFHGGRIIDLAHGAAQELGVTSSGVAQVKLEVLR
jgi:rare lipoprotein A